LHQFRLPSHLDGTDSLRSTTVGIMVSGQCRPQQLAIVSHSFPPYPTVWDVKSLFTCEFLAFLRRRRIRNKLTTQKRLMRNPLCTSYTAAITVPPRKILAATTHHWPRPQVGSHYPVGDAAAIGQSGNLFPSQLDGLSFRPIIGRFKPGTQGGSPMQQRRRPHETNDASLLVRSGGSDKKNLHLSHLASRQRGPSPQTRFAARQSRPGPFIGEGSSSSVGRHEFGPPSALPRLRPVRQSWVVPSCNSHEKRARPLTPGLSAAGLSHTSSTPGPREFHAVRVQVPPPSGLAIFASSYLNQHKRPKAPIYLTILGVGSHHLIHGSSTPLPLLLSRAVCAVRRTRESFFWSIKNGKPTTHCQRHIPSSQVPGSCSGCPVLGFLLLRFCPVR
jgi:hypothetical protein